MADKYPRDWRSDASLPAPYDEPFTGRRPEARELRPYAESSRADIEKAAGREPLDMIGKGYGLAPSLGFGGYHTLDSVYGSDPATYNALERFMTTPGGQATSTLLNVLPVAKGPALAIFAGPAAKTANLAALERAQAKTAQGVPREQIWREEGWFQAPDKNWKWEISDNAALDKALARRHAEWQDNGRGGGAAGDAFKRLNAIAPNLIRERDAGRISPAKAESQFQAARQEVVDARAKAREYEAIADRLSSAGRLPDVLHHPELYAAYPELDGIRADLFSPSVPRRANAMFDDFGRTGSVKNTFIGVAPHVTWEARTPKVLHETQHGLQNLENFARGSDIVGVQGSEAVRAIYDKRVAEATQRYRDAESAVKANRTAGNIHAFERASSELAQIGTSPGPKDILEAYHRSAGEVEARAVEKRRGMTPHERRERPPWLDYDVPEPDQIVSFGGGPAASARLPMDPASREARARAWEGYDPGTRWYHGSDRIDRVVEKGKLDPRRASSGPMPFFTDEPQIASNYALGKPDVSLPDSGIAQYFTVSPKDLGWARARSPVSVEQSWHHLPSQTRAEIADKATRVGYQNRDMGDGPFVLHDEFGSLSSPDHYKYLLDREARGNHLAALRMLWHDGGDLIGNEHMMADIWKLAGYPHAISQYSAPWTHAQGVLPARLSMENPLVTTNFDELRTKVIPALEDAFKRDRTRLKQFGADDWDKNTRYTPKEWVKALKEDLMPDPRTGEPKNSYVWASIPDKVTDQLKRLGYDSIVDMGGKSGGDGHRVAIPFYPNQVRSINAAFDPAKAHSDRLLDSRLLPFGGAAIGAAALGAYSGDANAASLEPYKKP